MIDDCDTKLKAEYCHRFLDAIYHGDNDLAIFLIDDLIKKGVDITCPFIVDFHFREHDLPCSTLYYACLFNRIVIIKHLLDTSLFNDCIILVINKLLENRSLPIREYNKLDNVDFDPKIMYNYRNKEYIENHKRRLAISGELSKQSHDKLKRILKLLLSHLSQKRIEMIQIPEPLVMTMEDIYGDDLEDLEEYTGKEIEEIKKELDESNDKTKKEHDEIVDIIKNHPGSIFKEPSSDLNEFNLKKIPNPLRAGGVKKSKKSKKMQTKSKKRKGKKSRKYYKK
jgi:Txe/YoeB family toxin of Txe-Axe toxin-antitoxin module